MKHTTWAIVLFVFVIGAVVGYRFGFNNEDVPPITDNGIACTMEAKICPDGSSVGRSGPRCEFAPCPATRRISLYYYDAKRDVDGAGILLCSQKGLVAVPRDIAVTQTPIQDAVRLLLTGALTSQERASGVTTEFPLQGVALQAASLRDGILTLTLADTMHTTGGGSCRVNILRAQVEATARQFDGVREVRFAPEDLFQP